VCLLYQEQALRTDLTRTDVTAVTLVQSDTIPKPLRSNKTTPHKVVATGTKHITRIWTDKTCIRPHLLWDVIHVKSLDLETFLAGGVPQPQRSGSWPSAPRDD
jgi:hypothetical protein